MPEHMLGETESEVYRNETADGMLDDEGDRDQTIEEAEAEANVNVEEDLSDEDVETDIDDNEDDEEEDDDDEDVQKIFEESGLDKRYASVADLVRRQKANDGYITKIQQINADYRRQLDQRRETPQETQRKAPVAIDPDNFLENPNAALESGGYVRLDDVERLLADREAKAEARRVVERQDEDAQRFVDSKPDFEALQSRMGQIIAERPVLNNIPPAEALSLAYDLAKSEQPSNRTTKKSNKDKAARAKTSSGRSKGKTPGGEPNFEKMSIKQMESHFGFADD